MAIKQAQYKITLQSGEDIYHFQTDDNMVKIVDGNKNVVGTFKEYAMEGKTVTSGSFKNLKISGIYKIQNVTGLPSGYAVGKISILSVRAVGKVGSPDFISYDLISQSGEVFHNTVFNGAETGWTSGGTTLKNTITTITTQIGTVANLKTKAKANVVNAVNELKNDADLLKTNFDKLNKDYDDFTKHNHDERYLSKSGDTVTGNLIVSNDNRLRGLRTTGASANLIGFNKTNDILLGETGVKLLASGSDIRFNGKKVWHEDNDGAGSGLDADKLGGVASSNYARTDRETKTSANFITERALYAGTGLHFGTTYDGRYGSIIGNSSGSIRVSNGKSTYHEFTSSGIFQSNQRHELMATSREASLRFRLNGSETGIGLYRSNNSKHLHFYNWTKSKRAGYIHNDTTQFYFDEPINISGRRLFLQGSTPTGSIPTGSIWIS